MKKILFILALILVFSCEPADNCVTADIHVYSLSGKINDRYSTKTLCTESEFAKYPEGTKRIPLCSDCVMTVKYY